METLLSGFQTEIGSISSDIKILQEKSMDMGLRLKNRKDYYTIQIHHHCETAFSAAKPSPEKSELHQNIPIGNPDLTRIRPLSLHHLLPLLSYQIHFPAPMEAESKETVMMEVAESKLAKFVEDIIVPPRMIDVIVDGRVEVRPLLEKFLLVNSPVNEEYMRTLEILSKKLKFADADLMVKTSKALKDVQPELGKISAESSCEVERLKSKRISDSVTSFSDNISLTQLDKEEHKLDTESDYLSLKQDWWQL
ncbi:hypothetical protein HAX54_035914 [Datura stramonium]|uniref:Vps52 coiled-coil domain-containing protein n=1 Tax=Datura stramonium TaxID=4076 RepID=A0ABS8VG51_DATST|nr:hypothetical protein [Datura stramonium]